MQASLNQYFEALRAGSFPSYANIKQMLGMLRSALNQDNAYQALRNHYNQCCQLVDQVFATHRDLANKNNRDPIEEKRRQDMNTDWYQSDPANLSDGERKATELISAIELAHFLLTKVRCNQDSFKNFLGLETSAVFGFAKLVSAFTRDFKALEIYLHYVGEDKSAKLTKEMVEYLYVIDKERSRYTDDEREDFHSLVLKTITNERCANQINEEIKKVVDFFTCSDLTMGSRCEKLLSSMMLTDMACNRVPSEKHNQKVRDQWAKITLTFALDAIGKIVKSGRESMEDDKHLNKVDNMTEQRRFENSLQALSLFVPIFDYTVNRLQRDQTDAARKERAKKVDAILQPNNQRFLKAYENHDLKGTEKLTDLVVFLVC